MRERPLVGDDAQLERPRRADIRDIRKAPGPRSISLVRQEHHLIVPHSQQTLRSTETLQVLHPYFPERFYRGVGQRGDEPLVELRAEIVVGSAYLLAGHDVELVFAIDPRLPPDVFVSQNTDPLRANLELLNITVIPVPGVWLLAFLFLLLCGVLPIGEAMFIDEQGARLISQEVIVAHFQAQVRLRNRERRQPKSRY